MTIGQTSVKLSTIIEHSLRRVGIPAEAQTPEIVSTAKNNLFFVLNNFTNKGMNYWCIDQQFLPLIQGQVSYDLPDGTIDLLDTNYRAMTVSSGTDNTSVATEIVREYTETTALTMFRLNSPYIGTITISYSTDGVSYTVHSTITHDGTNKWYNVEPAINDVFVKLSIASGTFTVTELVTVSTYIDTPMYRMNRNQYASLPNKQTEGRPLQFWFDRQLDPVMNIWPTANSSIDNCIHTFRKHQIPDVGSLTEELAIPNRWLEATIWGLAQNMAFEIPNTQPDRITMCSTMADKTLLEAQGEERDNSTIEFAPAIGVYTA